MLKDAGGAFRRRAVRGGVLLMLLGSAVVSTATERDESAAPATEAAASISAQDAANIVRQAYGGRIVATTPATRASEGKKQSGFRVRADVKGRVKTVFVDSSGRIREDQQQGA